MKKTLFSILIFVLVFSNISFSSQILVGVNKIIVWNFWEENNGKFINKYLIYNPLEEDISLTINVVDIIYKGRLISTKIDSNFSSIGPLRIKAKNYIIKDNIFYQDNNVKDKLLQFLMNDSLFIGNIYTTIEPPSHFIQGKINSLLNNSHKVSYVSWSQDHIVFEEDTDYSINLNIYPNENFKKGKDRQIFVLVSSTDTMKDTSNKVIETIKSIECKTLRKEVVNHKAVKEAYQFDVPETDENIIHTITIDFKTPKVNEITYRQFVAGDSYSGGKVKRYLIFPIIVVPKL
jgi:ribosomal protein S16